MTVTRFGLTWWGRRWIGSLEALGAAYENRLPRGRTYARRGAVRRLEVAAGRVTARVDGSRAQPYRVTLRLPVFSDDQWDAIVAALARQVRHSAALLDGRMPDDVDETLAGCGLSLFPHTGELATTCSCPDHANPCKHVAAVHYVLAQTFDSDPFLLPALRGCGRDDLLAALRAARTGETPPAGGNDDEPGDGSGVPWRELSAAGLYQAAGDLAAIAVHPQPPAERTATATVRRLGPPPLPGADAGEIVAAAVAAAADRAWLLATGVGDTAERALGSDEAAVLAEVRRLGSTTTRAVADHLDRPADLVRATLRTLVAAGLVTRTGHARGTRYRPS